MKDFKNFRNYKRTQKKPLHLRKFLWVFVFLVVSGIIFYAVYKAFIFLSNTKNTQLKYVYIKGNNFLQSQYIYDTLRINNNTKLTNELKIQVYNILKKDPFIKNVSVAIVEPDTLYINLEEKKPLCILENNNRQLLFDTNGQFITDNIDTKKINTNKILHIKMLNLTPQINEKSVVLSLVELYKRLDKLEKISYINMEDNSFDVFFENGMRIKANMKDCDYKKSVDRLTMIWPKLLPDVQKIDSVSICYPDRIIIKWKTKEIDSGR